MVTLDEIAPETVRPLRRVEYEQMVDLGVFDDEKVELLEGVIVAISPQGTEHASAIDVLNALLMRALYPRARVRIQSSYAASDISEPEPDVAVVPPGDYRRAHPAGAWLVIEVAKSSRKKDRGLKARLYAKASVEEYWVVDLVDEVVFTHGDADPTKGSYGTVTKLAKGERMKLRHFPDVEIAVDDISGLVDRVAAMQRRRSANRIERPPGRC